MSDQRVVVFGAGTAGIGVADLMVDLMVAEASTARSAVPGSGASAARG